MASDEQERRLLIRNLASRGGMARDESGQYFSDNAKDDFKAKFPTYDLAKLREAFPSVLEIDMAAEEDEETGSILNLVAVFKDGRSDFEVPLGVTPPDTTEGLIEKVRSHLRSLVDVDSLRETSEVFDEFDGG
jgi:hypothetical protein